MKSPATKLLYRLLIVTAMLYLYPSEGRAQTRQTVTGSVVDEADGSVLPGVNIRINGTTLGTTTDIDGNYELAVPSLNETLVFSYVGYETREVPIDGQTRINVALKAQVLSTQEIVVVGYGVQRKSEVTGAVGMVDAKDLEQSTFNPLYTLKGSVPGVQVFTNSGSPTGDNRVVIRGTGTINASSSPLYVVDGVVMDNINTMNPGDIESIEVLKDASSAAIYGSRGANGVVLITTKRGLSGGLVVDYSSNVSMGVMASRMDALNASEFVEVLRRGYANAVKYDNYPAGKEPVLNRSDPDLFDANGNPLYDTDWQKEATRTAHSNSHQLSIRQGSEKSQFGAFFNYANREGVFLNSWMQRANAKLTYDTHPTTWLTLGANVTVTKTWSNDVAESGGGFHASRSMIETPPIFPVKWPDGKWAHSAQSTGITFEGQANPVQRLLEEENLKNFTGLFGNAYATFQLAPHLELKSQFGVDNGLYETRYYAPSDLITVGNPDGYASIYNGESTYWQNENFLTYANDFGPHRINALLGASWQQKDVHDNTMSASGFSNDFFEYNNIGSGSDQNPSTSNAYDWTMNSYFSRATYTYNDRYSATVTGRLDGSSRFGSNNKYGFFPSVGVSWLVSEEGFMKSIDLVDDLRLRGSYGIVGNTEIGLFQSLATVGSSTTLIGGSLQSISYITRLANPDLSWEKTRTYDAGIEAGLFNNIVSFEVDYYDKLTSDLILSRPVPASTGFTTILDNVGSVSNKGLDVKVTTLNIKKANLLWTTTLLFNFNKNEVVKLGENDEDIFPGPNWVDGSQTILRVGEPIGSYWGYVRYGTWGTDEVAEAAAVGAIPGEAKRSKEKTIIGDAQPDFTGSFSNSVTFGPFDASIELEFSYGAEVMQQFLATAEDRMGLTNGITSQLYDSWTEGNQNTMVQQIRDTNLSGQNLTVDSRWIADGSYIRGSLISFGYSFGPRVLALMGVDQLRVSAWVENAFLIHSKEFVGFDPEASTYTGNFGQGIFFYEYPKARTYSLGVNLRF